MHTLLMVEGCPMIGTIFRSDRLSFLAARKVHYTNLLYAELCHCWPSLVSAFLVVPGYLLVGYHILWGWPLLVGSNLFMVLIAKRTRQWGLFIALAPMAT